MHARLPEALSRTTLLMRDELVEQVDDALLISALTRTSIVLVGDAWNLSSHSAQTAFITAAMLMARSGHRVHLSAPDLPLLGVQPPLRGERLISALLSIGNDILPDVGFSVYPPRSEASLQVIFGDSPPRFRARRTITLNASAWSAVIDTPDRAQPWMASEWPCGALAAAGLSACEAFKVCMRTLRRWARDASRFDDLFRHVTRASLELAPADTPRIADLGRFDFVSGGAITNSTLYALARLPGVTGSARIIEPQLGDYSNLNRYMLMLLSAVNQPKGWLLSSLMPPQLSLTAIPVHYASGRVEEVGAFAPKVLVGVDDIPTRWSVQVQQPQWLGIGATTHWDAMASFHQQGLACAQCLHPRDDPTVALIPTIAFVSYFAGLLLACYFLRSVTGGAILRDQQCTYFSPLRPELIWRTPVAHRPMCPTCLVLSTTRAA